ncbi:MAG: Uridylate kinase [Candidatus Methanolliviera sp. GoM_asphalt]|nr:MAG: Uridylate kinase [Candidatus Methanolliviera sp. GoM_asphalt]
MRVVLSLGGSILMRGFSSQRIEDYAKVIDEISEENKVFVVVGGGEVARRYIKISRELGSDESHSDYIGIWITRMNAKLLIYALSDKAYPEVPENFREAKKASLLKDIVVMGGTEPGHTTDAVSAILSEYVGADILINATSVDGVYEEDPKKNPCAKRFDHLTPKALIEIIAKYEMNAGINTVLDILAAKIIERSRIPTYIIDGNDPKNILRAVRGEKIGTKVGVR